jgi:1-deoxy-D-xylulose-5-phosphate reductoisomerase
MKNLAILGSTGSIGRSTLSIVESYPERFRVLTLAGGKNLEAAYEQARRWREGDSGGFWRPRHGAGGHLS